MFKQLLILSLFSSITFCGKYTGEALYYVTKGTCYGTAVAVTAAATTNPGTMVAIAGTIIARETVNNVANSINPSQNKATCALIGLDAAIKTTTVIESASQKARNMGNSWTYLP